MVKIRPRLPPDAIPSRRGPAVSTGVGPRAQGPPHLSEGQEDAAAAVLLAGKADVTVRGEHPPGGVAATERRPEGAVHDRMQPLLPRHPEERPEELTLRPGFQVPGGGGREQEQAGGEWDHTA